MNTLSQERINIIRTRLEQTIIPIEYLEIIDESDQHRGHAGYGEGSRHFAIIIASPILSSLSRIEAHRKIYTLFTDMIPSPIHALRIDIKRSV